MQKTIRAPASSNKVPTSLRVLFEENDPHHQPIQQDNYRPPAPIFTPQLSGSTDEISNNFVRDWDTQDPDDTSHTLSSSPVSIRTRPPVPPPNTSPEMTIPPSFSRLGNKATSPNNDSIDYKPNLTSSDISSPITTTVVPASPINSTDTTKPPPRPARQLADDASKQFLDLASPSAFQFPRPSTASGDTRPSRLRPTLTKKPPSRPSTSTGLHQNAHSLDTSAAVSRYEGGPSATGLMSRTRSATTPPPMTPLDLDPAGVTPRPSYAMERKFSDQPQYYNLGTPGLKDVLKVRISATFRIR
ncbi:hypothetical protein BJ165DRAFT_1079979 [Panaeolus papilionaceus]|nr:hypothetical protein BJ165DRAFT_1079979 [Panaeolus papilionaceus]